MPRRTDLASMNFDFGVARILTAQDPKEISLPTQGGRLQPAHSTSGHALNSILTPRNIDAAVNSKIAKGFESTPVLHPALFLEEVEAGRRFIQTTLDGFTGPASADRPAKLKRMLEQLAEHKELYDQLRGNMGKLVSG